MPINFELSDGFQSEAGAIIKVISVGGGGGNAIENMIANKVENVEFICGNTDVQALKKSSASVVLQLGEEVTQGLGAGADPAVGARAAEESRAHIAQAISGANILFIAVGMGGGTGTGAAPIVAQLAKEQGILTVAVVTRPFSFEGRRRAQVASAGIEALSKHVDSLITIPNDKLLSVLGKSISLLDAFKAANDVLQGAVQGIADLITRPGLINVDFADVRTVMSEMGMAMMGSGSASGKDRAREAAQAAISSPLLEDINLSGARGVLVNISGGFDMSIGEFEIVGDVIRSFTSEDAIVVLGTVVEPDMSDELRVTIVATGLGNDNAGDDASSSAPASAAALASTHRPQHQQQNQPRVPLAKTPFQKEAVAATTSSATPQDAALTGSMNNDGTMNYRQLERPTVVRQNTFETSSNAHANRYSNPTSNPAPRSSQSPIPPPPVMTTEYLDIPTFLRQQRHHHEVVTDPDDDNTTP